jgi:predicted metal-dependent phosphoesterase TrpH
MHSTASDGAVPPAGVVRKAHGLGLVAIALTDHDSIAGLPDAIAEGERLGVRVVGGCEFSVGVPWGEMHCLGYFLPAGSDALDRFLEEARADRERRMRAMLHRLATAGAPLTEADVLAESAGGAVGRPHVARALVRAGHVASVNAAFDRFLGRGRIAFVDKALPPFREVADLVHRVGGIVSAAHLKDRATRTNLARLADEGLDAVEVRHPSHDAETRLRIADLAAHLGLGASGGSDWHGDGPDGHGHDDMGSQQVPFEWLAALEARRPAARPAA